MEKILEKLFPIMFFYSLLSFFIFPLIGYYITKKIDGIGFGILIGCVISIVLWFLYGKKMVMAKV